MMHKCIVNMESKVTNGMNKLIEYYLSMYKRIRNLMFLILLYIHSPTPKQSLYKF